ncbi:MAG TPA: hypothetical protein VL727_25925 [Puia sp.]|nr:hypothetical protein [Puia sp.]
MKKIVVYLAAFLFAGFFYLGADAQKVDAAVQMRGVKAAAAQTRGTKAAASDTTVDWPAGKGAIGRLVLGLGPGDAVFRSVLLVKDGKVRTCLRDADPMFLLRVGTRDLVTQNGWNIFFDKVPLKPYKNYALKLIKEGVKVTRRQARTVVRIGVMETVDTAVFRGWLEITLYHGAPLFNVAAVLHTARDSTAILYDAGLVSRVPGWDSASYYTTDDVLHSAALRDMGGLRPDSLIPQAVKYRAVAAVGQDGALAVFPAPHQYFYPLDEAFNLKFVWYSSNGIGIRQDPEGDHRYVPWFNAPPGTLQRCGFFCLMGIGAGVLDAVRKYTHDDAYVRLPGYRTYASHFHNEFISTVVLAGKPVPADPSFKQVFRRMGVDMVHLAEFHGPGHPRGPDSLRLRELQALFAQCRRLSDTAFLLMPGEEPNEFFGGHWLAFFPKPVYWVMSRKPGQEFETQDPVYGRVYHVGDTADMFQLLKKESGLAWTAHPRTKGSTGYPDTYKNTGFFRSDHWLGGAWKALPADLSQPRLGRRVLDLLDDMNNWGVHKQAPAEADIFSIEPQNEMYAHMNVNYLRMGRLPAFDTGWRAVLDTLRKGKFFSTTGEVLIPLFEVGREASYARFSLQWTFPLHFAEIVSGDGTKVYRQRIDLDATEPFGQREWRIPVDLRGRKWVRFEVWDVAANGAFTQTYWMDGDN